MVDYGFVIFYTVVFFLMISLPYLYFERKKKEKKIPKRVILPVAFLVAIFQPLSPLINVALCIAVLEGYRYVYYNFYKKAKKHKAKKHA